MPNSRLPVGRSPTLTPTSTWSGEPGTFTVSTLTSEKKPSLSMRVFERLSFPVEYQPPSSWRSSRRRTSSRVVVFREVCCAGAADDFITRGGIAGDVDTAHVDSAAGVDVQCERGLFLGAIDLGHRIDVG